VTQYVTHLEEISLALFSYASTPTAISMLKTATTYIFVLTPVYELVTITEAEQINPCPICKQVITIKETQILNIDTTRKTERFSN